MADGRNEVRCSWCVQPMRQREDAGPARRWHCEACGAEAMQWRPFVLAGTPEAPIPTVHVDAGGRA